MKDFSVLSASSNWLWISPFQAISINLKFIKILQRFYNHFLYTVITFSVIWYCLKLSALTYHWIIPFYCAFRYKNIFLYQYCLYFYILYLIFFNSIRHYNASFVSIYFYLLQVFFLLIFLLLDISFTSLQIISAFLYRKFVALFSSHWFCNILPLFSTLMCVLVTQLCPTLCEPMDCISFMCLLDILPLVKVCKAAYIKVYNRNQFEKKKNNM